MGSISSSNVVIGYVHACAAKSLPWSECGPVWQLGVIALLIVLATLTLAMLRMRPAVRPA